MDIGPVSAVRPVAMVRPSPSAPDLSRVVEAQNRGHSREDEYTSADGKPSRGLEDEEDTGEPEQSPEASAAVAPSGKVSFFA